MGPSSAVASSGCEKWGCGVQEMGCLVKGGAAVVASCHPGDMLRLGACRSAQRRALIIRALMRTRRNPHLAVCVHRSDPELTDVQADSTCHA